MEQRYSNLYNKILQKQDHPDFVDGFLTTDKEINVLDGDTIINDHLLDDIDLLTQKFIKRTALTEQDGQKIFQPVKRMAKTRTKNDLAPSHIINEQPKSLTERIQALAMTAELRLAPNTQKVRLYAERNYLMFYENMTAEADFQGYQEQPFPIKKVTFLLFLWSMRVELNYSYKTVRDTFANSLANHLRDTRRGDPKQEFGNDMKHLLRALLRKYGNQTHKVSPLLNKDLRTWTSRLNLYDEGDARINAIIQYGRAGGQRFDTYVAAQIQHIKWHLVDDKIVSIFTIVKDKVLLHEPREQTIYGTGNMITCPNLALLWYLSTKRHVFACDDFQQLIRTGDFQVRQECLTWPLFTHLNENNVIVDNNALSKSMKLSAAKHLAKRYTPRSFRSGCVCQFIINGIRSKGSVDTSDYIAIKTHVGWRDEKSILCYIRTAQTKYQHIQSLLDPDAFSNPIGDVIELIAITTGDSTNRQPSRCESSDQVVLPKRKRQAKRQVLETISTVRWRKLPKDMKAFVLKHNSSLKERVANDKSKKNYVWTTYWQALLGFGFGFGLLGKTEPRLVQYTVMLVVKVRVEFVVL